MIYIYIFFCLSLPPSLCVYTRMIYIYIYTYTVPIDISLLYIVFQYLYDFIAEISPSMYRNMCDT